ncbi:GIY-YIG nuclease family protein [Sphingobium lignivorans]|uniref:GIY-YIG nuclease family protein n=1 Tax=Sphingobium lignivorans TaxID=2735886 RepID=UPI003B82F6C7
MRESSSDAAMKRCLDPYVYLLASRRNGTLYLGVTSNLMQRIAQHRAETFGGFSADQGSSCWSGSSSMRRWSTRSCVKSR